MGRADDNRDQTAWSDVVTASDKPALVVDVADARFLAANAAAESLWGATRLAGACLDRAMPALARLRQRARQAEAGEPLSETLVLWTARGSRRLTATFRRPDPAHPGVFLVEFVPSDSPLASARGAPAAAMADVEAQPRRIRPAGTAAADDAPAAADMPKDASPRRDVQPEAIHAVAPQIATAGQVAPDPPPRSFSALDRTRTTDGRQSVSEGHKADDPPPATDAADRLPAGQPGRAGDAETLKEIARRIREGRSAGQAADATRENSAYKQSTAPSKPASANTSGPPVAEAQRLARLAHELRTPISSIAALAEIMRDEHFGPLGDKRYLGYAGDIHDSARHMLGVLEGMLDPLGVVRDLPRLAMTEVDVADIVARSARAMQPIAARAGVTITTVPAARLPRVIADRVSIRQIMFNLISNAIRHTPEGGRVEATATIDPDGRLRLTVADNGTGMTEAQVLAVFRAAAPASDRGTVPTSGYGLPLVRALTARNGAELAIASTVGEGTSVTIHFPSSRLVPV